MKKPSKWMLCWSLCLLAGTSFAQMYDYGTPLTRTGSESNRVAQAREMQSQKFCRSKDLVGADIKDAQGNKLGDIDEILINPQNGETFASVAVENDRYAVIPIQALHVTPDHGLFRNANVTLNATKQSLQSGPTLAKNEWRNLDRSDFTQRVYSHYNLEPPSSAMGGTDSNSLGGESGGHDLSNTNHVAEPMQEK